MSKSLAEKRAWANTLAGATLLPAAYRKQPANLFLAAEYADTLGVPRMAALTGIHIIDGKPSMSADLMAAQVRRAGHKLRVKARDTEAVAQLVRKDDPDFTYECVWTLDRAKKAGLLSKKGGSWAAYPAAMLKARAVSEVIREGASEVLFGAIYTPEELDSADPADIEFVADTETVVAAHSTLLDHVWGLAEKLNLDRETLEKTLRYVCREGEADLDALTETQAEALIEYLEVRLTQRATTQEGDVVEAELVVEGDDGE